MIYIECAVLLDKSYDIYFFNPFYTLYRLTFNTISFYDGVSFLLHQTLFWALKLTQKNFKYTTSKNDYITLRIQRRFIMSLKTHQQKTIKFSNSFIYVMNYH